LRWGFSAGFVALLLLGLVWPSPVLWLNGRTFEASLSIGPSSFLGREAPSWDLVFWGIAGLYALLLLHVGQGRLTLGAEALKADCRSLPRRFSRRARRLSGVQLLLGGLLAAVAVGSTWLFFDGALLLMAEAARVDGSRTTARLLNRLGGGMNPALIIGFFVLAGLALGDRRWSRYGLAMGVAGLVSGATAQIVKVAVDRSRPEMWLGPFHFAESASTSFPSGHTVGAFALAAVLLFGSRSMPLRITAMSLAIGIGASRVIGFRHWPSDVLASALIGVFLGWIIAVAVLRDLDYVAETVPAHPPQDPVGESV
jgi:membrane-associated phospholipid phosphatase